MQGSYILFSRRLEAEFVTRISMDSCAVVAMRCDLTESEKIIKGRKYFRRLRFNRF